VRGLDIAFHGRAMPEIHPPSYVRPGVVVEETFADVPLGHVPESWIAQPCSGCSIGVDHETGYVVFSDEAGAGPGRVLSFESPRHSVSGKGPDTPSRLEIPLNIESPTARLCFVVRLSISARFDIRMRTMTRDGPCLKLGAYPDFGAAVEWASDAADPRTSPQVLISAGDWDSEWRNPKPDDGHEMSEPPESWLAVEIVLTGIGTADTACDVTVARLKLSDHTYRRVAHFKAPLKRATLAQPPAIRGGQARGAGRRRASAEPDVQTGERLEAVEFLLRPDETGRPCFARLDNVFVTVATVRTEPVSYINLKPEIDQFAGIDLAERSVHRVFDGNLNMYWKSGRRRVDVIVSFPNPVAVNGSLWFHVPAGVFNEADHSGLKDYNILYAADEAGREWKSIFSREDYEGSLSHDVFEETVVARHVKLEILQTQGTLNPVLTEWKLFHHPAQLHRRLYALRSAEVEQAEPSSQDQVEQSVPGRSTSAASDIEITFENGKMLYESGRPVQLEGTIKNSGPGDATIEVTVWHRCGVDEAEPRTWVEKAPRNDLVSFAFTIQEPAEYGHHIRAAFRRDGTVIHRSEFVFEVIDDWRKIARMDQLQVQQNLVADFPQEGITERYIPLWRRLHVNAVEFFSQHVFYGQHDTDQTEWDSPLPYWHNNTRTAATALAWTGACADNGIRTVIYSRVGQVSPECGIEEIDPGAVPYGPVRWEAAPATEYHSLWQFFYNGDAEGSTFPAGRPIYLEPKLDLKSVDLYARRDAMADDIANAVARFGWDGLFFDNFAWDVECSGFRHDRNGKALNEGLTPDQIGEAFLNAVKERVQSRAGKNTMLMANFGLSRGTSPWWRADQSWPSDEFPVYARTLSALGIAYLEMQKRELFDPDVPDPNTPPLTDKPHFPPTVEQAVRALRLIREAGNVAVPVMIALSNDKPKKPVDKYVRYASAFANGVLIWIGRGTPTVTGDILTGGLAVEAAYNRFAARYGAYLFDLAIRWLPADTAMFSGAVPERVWCSNLAACRTYADGRTDIYLHMINRPVVPAAEDADEGADAGPGEIPWAKRGLARPEPVRDIKFRIDLDRAGVSDMALEGAWLLTPDRRLAIKPRPGKPELWTLLPESEADDDPVEMTQNVAIEGRLAGLTVPELRFWSMILMRWRPARTRPGPARRLPRRTKAY